MNTRELLNRATEGLSVGRAFGAAYEKDGLLVIPVAIVAGGGGGGEGPVSPPARRADAATRTGGEGPGDHEHALPLGSGGGFGGLVLPIGAYVVKGDTVRWVPAIDVSRVLLAGLGVVRLLVRSRTVARLRRTESGRGIPARGRRRGGRWAAPAGVGPSVS